MISKITIDNFQSHKSTELELDKGVNVISGNSDAGKSAIMRAIIWGVQNNLQGDFFVSNWAKDKKGKQKATCSVSIDNVTRYKSADGNGYLVGDDKFEALRGNVPDQVSKELNLGEVNIQSQFDGPFMLSNTPGENERYINELVNLTDIDVATSWVGSEIRDCNKKQKELKAEVEDLESKAIDKAKLEAIDALLKNANNIANNVDKLEGLIENGKTQVNQYSSARRIDTTALEDKCKRIADIRDRGTYLAGKCKEGRKLLSELAELQQRYIGNLESIKLGRIERTGKLVEELTSLRATSLRNLAELEQLNETLKQCTKTEKESLAAMEGMVCPTCGRVLRVGETCND